jgi:ketosteroid isomerase-like protein
MKKLFLLLTLICFCLIPLSAQTEKPAKNKSSRIEKKVLLLEKQWAEALMKSDTAALERLYADDLSYTHSSGVTDDKATYLGNIRSGATKYEEVIFESQSVRVYRDVAVAFSTCKVRVTANGQKLNNTLKLTHIYARSGGEWRMVAHHSTRMNQ